MNRVIILCLAILLSVLMFLTAGNSREKMLSQEDENAIRDLHDKFEKCVIRADWSTLIEFYAEDAVRLLTNEPAIVGKESILEELKKWVGLSWEQWERPIKIVEGRGDLAFVWSIYKGKGRYGGNSFYNSF